MAIIKGGVSGTLWEMDAATKAGRTQVRPLDVGVLGSYALDTASGVMAAGLAAASPIYSCRWGDSTRAMALYGLWLEMNSLDTGFTAGLALFELLVARSFTASDSGGTSILPTGNAQKRRTSFGTTLLTDLRQASTGTLTAGTRTLDAQPIGTIRAQISATINRIFVPSIGTDGGAPHAALFAPDIASGEWPLVLVQNEGYIITATVPATGTWGFRVRPQWAEIVTTAGLN